MKFRLLYVDAFRFLFRARLLYLALGFSILLHVGGLKALKNLTFNYQGVVGGVGPREGMFISLFLTLFMGVFLSAVYGIWMVPQAHRGPRSLLTFVLPVNKLLYPAVYVLVFLVPVLIEFGIFAGSFTYFFGADAWHANWFSVPAILTCLLVEAVAFLTLVLLFSVLSMSIGQISTLFVGVFGFFILQAVGAALRFGLEEYAQQAGGGWQFVSLIYGAFPPLGELIFSLKQSFSQGVFPTGHLIRWVVWLGVLAGLFRWKLRYPLVGRSTES